MPEWFLYQLFIETSYTFINCADSAHPLLQPPLSYNLCHQPCAPQMARSIRRFSMPVNKGFLNFSSSRFLPNEACWTQKYRRELVESRLAVPLAARTGNTMSEEPITVSGFDGWGSALQRIHSKALDCLIRGSSFTITFPWLVRSVSNYISLGLLCHHWSSFAIRHHLSSLIKSCVCINLIVFKFVSCVLEFVSLAITLEITLAITWDPLRWMKVIPMFAHLRRSWANAMLFTCSRQSVRASAPGAPTSAWNPRLYGGQTNLDHMRWVRFILNHHESSNSDYIGFVFCSRFCMILCICNVPWCSAMCFCRCLFRARPRGNRAVFRNINGLWLAVVVDKILQRKERFWQRLQTQRTSRMDSKKM